MPSFSASLSHRLAICRIRTITIPVGFIKIIWDSLSTQSLAYSKSAINCSVVIITAVVVAEILNFYPREYMCVWVCMCINVYIQDIKERF